MTKTKNLIRHINLKCILLQSIGVFFLYQSIERFYIAFYHKVFECLNILFDRPICLTGLGQECNELFATRTVGQFFTNKFYCAAGGVILFVIFLGLLRKHKATGLVQAIVVLFISFFLLLIGAMRNMTIWGLINDFFFNFSKEILTAFLLSGLTLFLVAMTFFLWSIRYEKHYS